MSYYGPGSLFSLGTDEAPDAPPSTEAECEEGELLQWARDERSISRYGEEGCRNLGPFTATMTMRGAAGTTTSYFEQTAFCCPPDTAPALRADVLDRTRQIRGWFYGIVPNRRVATAATCMVGQAIPGVIRGGHWFFRAMPLFCALIGVAIDYHREGFGKRLLGYGAVGYAVGVVVPCMLASMLPET